jgi:hypothetical protein
VAVASLLLAVGAVGLRSWRSLHAVPANGGRLPSELLLIVFTALETTGAVMILIVLPALVRARRRRMATVLPRGPWARGVAVLFVLVVLLLPAAVLLMGSPGGRSLLARLRPAPPPVLPPGSHGRTPPSDGGSLTVIITAVVVVAAILLFLWWVRRPGEPVAAPPRPPHPLVAAVGAGQDALDRTDEPRAAVIACYAAMEDALSRSGATLRDADTPAEVLDRAASAGLVRSAAATTLTRLFREARYSLHPMGEEHRHSARSALQRLRRDLEGAP